jgi:hypothetical protein
MANSSRIRSPRVGLLLSGATFALMVFAASAVPTFAASTPFNAVFDETTTPRPCPAWVPAGAFCFTGVRTGPTAPPGGIGTERFAGFVDQAKRDPLTNCAPDFNVVSITTSAGTLFLTTQGNGCPISPTQSLDVGTWKALGGTGIFDEATGSGTVSTTATFGATITSKSTYSGTLNLSSERGDRHR